MAGRASVISSDISSGLAAAVRTARGFDVSDQLGALRRTDAARGLEGGRDAAAAVAETIARLQGRRHRRSRRRPAIAGLAIGIIGVAGVIGVAAWWLRRRAAAVAVRDERLDMEALDRSASEGMGTAIGSQAAALGPPESLPTAEAIADMAITDMTDEHTTGAMTPSAT
jgi:hypothetical protein